MKFVHKTKDRKMNRRMNSMRIFKLLGHENQDTAVCNILYITGMPVNSKSNNKTYTPILDDELVVSGGGA